MEFVTPANAAVLFLDLQAEIIKNNRTLPPNQLQRCAMMLAGSRLSMAQLRAEIARLRA